MTVKLKPIGARLVVQKETGDRMTAGKLIIAAAVKQRVEAPARAKVIAVGKGTRDNRGEWHPMALKEGDIVLVNDKAGGDINIDGRKLTILQYVDVYGSVPQQS